MAAQIIDSIKLQDVRSHRQSFFQFHKNINAIVGPNGSGKTTLIEALYVLLCGKSFRGGLPEMLRWGRKQAVLEVTLSTGETHGVRRLLVEQASKGVYQKRWNIGEQKNARMPLAKRLPVVLFEPDIGRMITGSPEKRRTYLDSLTSQLDITVAESLHRFERILKQRNSLLKTMSPHAQSKTEIDQLFIWNTQLSALSEIIVASRIALLKELQRGITKEYNKLGGTDNILLTYESRVSTDPKTYANKLLHFLETSLMRDIVLGHTGFGPHRDDFEIRLSDQPARERASRGEIRTIVLALKLLEAELLSRQYAPHNIKPILLFDDVLSELDLHHQEQILAGFKNYQVFLTTTDAHTLTPGTYTVALD